MATLRQQIMDELNAAIHRCDRLFFNGDPPPEALDDLWEVLRRERQSREEGGTDAYSG